MVKLPTPNLARLQIISVRQEWDCKVPDNTNTSKRWIIMGIGSDRVRHSQSSQV